MRTVLRAKRFSRWLSGARDPRGGEQPVRVLRQSDLLRRRLLRLCVDVQRNVVVEARARRSEHVTCPLEGNVYCDTENGNLVIPNVLNAVSCTSTTSCAAVDAGGNAAVLSGRSWSPSHEIDPVAAKENAQFDPGSGLTSVSCASADDCVAVDDEGNVYIGTVLDLRLERP